MLDANKQIAAVGIVADSDTSAADRLEEIREALEDVNTDPDAPDRYSIPAACDERADQNDIAVTITLIPDSATPGCLETLLLRALRKKYPDEMACVDELAECADLAAWGNANNRDKALVGLAISSILEEDPLCTLPRVFRDHANFLPAGDAEFADLIAHLNAV